MKTDTISKIDNKFNYESPLYAIERITAYFDNADDLGWQNDVKNIAQLFELYWIMCEELDNGGLFSDWKELMADKCYKIEEVEEMCADFNKRIGVDLFSVDEFKECYGMDY